MSEAVLQADHEISIRAAANEWIGETFPKHRRHLAHTRPKRDSGMWAVQLVTQRIEGLDGLGLPGQLWITDDAIPCQTTICQKTVCREIDRLLAAGESPPETEIVHEGDGFEFWFGDGIGAVAEYDDRAIDLLLTDPPYGISNAYTCENQISRRLRKNGSDFIMPKGDFGAWDKAVNPHAWTAEVLPKVGGWAVIFCAQAQIGIYCGILESFKFNSVGTLVWKKTNPVPFNHRFKPINSWEALVVGKRPGTKFNGHVVHNVFTHKSPSPQQRIHPTQKPLPLMREFVELFSDAGDLIYDPFAGAATTLIAAAELKRHAVSYENDWTIYQRARGRIVAALEG